MLILTLMMLSFLSVLEEALLTSTMLDAAINDAYIRDVQLNNWSEAGLEEARERLRELPELPAPSLSAPLVSAASNQYSAFLVGSMNNVLTLRSTATIGRYQKTMEAMVTKIRLPLLPSGLTFAGDAGSDPRLSSTNGVNRVVDELSRVADETFSTVALGNVGNSGDYRVTAVNGDCEFGPGSGYGVLIVRGRLILAGNFEQNGLIIAVGDGSIEAAQDAAGSIRGGVFMARTVDASAPTLNIDSSRVMIQKDDAQMDSARYRLPFTRISVRYF